MVVYTGGDKHLRVDLYSRFAQGKGVLQLLLAFVAWLLSYSPLQRASELSVSNFVEQIFVQMVAGFFVVEPSVPAVVAAFAEVVFGLVAVVVFAVVLFGLAAVVVFAAVLFGLAAVVVFVVVLFGLAAVVVFVVVLSGLAAVVVFVVQVACSLYAVPAQQLL